MWAKLDDGFPDHPKVLALSDRAFRAHIEGICYSARMLTDGLIPRAAVRGGDRAITELLGAGLWIEQPRGFQIHDFLDYNKSREQVLSERRASAERRASVGRRGGQQLSDGRKTEQSPDPTRPLPEVVQDQELPTRPADLAHHAAKPLPPTAGNSEGWKSTPHGWSDVEAALVRKLTEREPVWGDLTPGAVNKLNGIFGRPIVTMALQRAWEEVSSGILGADVRPYPLLNAICEDVQAKAAAEVTSG